MKEWFQGASLVLISHFILDWIAICIDGNGNDERTGCNAVKVTAHIDNDWDLEDDDYISVLVEDSTIHSIMDFDRFTPQCRLEVDSIIRFEGLSK